VGSFAVLLLGLIALAGLTPILALWLDAPAEQAQVISPVAMLRLDRTATLIYGLALSIPAGLLVAFASDFAVGPAIGLVIGVLVAIPRAWTVFLGARWRLAMSRRIPWRLMRFLDDAHHRGVLRQVGGVYQFRHAFVQDRLAEGA